MQNELPQGYMLIPDPKPVLLSILIIVLIALAIYAIYAVFQLVKTLKQSQKVLDEFEVVSRIASERTQQLDKIISEMEKKIKSGQTIFNSIPIILTAVSKIAKVVGQQNEKKQTAQTKQTTQDK